MKVAVDGGGNVVVIGTFYGGNPLNGGTLNDYYTAKYAAADGALLWEQYYNGPENGNDTPGGLAVDASGNVVVTGSSFLGSAYASNNGYGSYMAKYAAANGALLWERRGWPLPGNNERMPVAVDASGNVVVTGNSFNGSNNDYYTAKYAAADGALLWEKSYGPDNGGGWGFQPRPWPQRDGCRYRFLLRRHAQLRLCNRRLLGESATSLDCDGS